MKKVSRMSQGSLKVISGIFMGVLRVFQGCFKEFSMVFCGSFKGERSYMDVSRKLQGRLKGVFREF